MTESVRYRRDGLTPYVPAEEPEVVEVEDYDGRRGLHADKVIIDEVMELHER